MSWQMRAVAGVLRATRKRRYATYEAGARVLAEPKGPIDPPGDLEASLRTVAGFPVHTVGSKGSTGTVVYLHGGAYVSRIHAYHWGLVADLAALGIQVQVPHYGLAPDHGPLAAHDLVHAVLGSIEGPAYLMGDSAGGGLALAATQTWLAGGGAAPVGLTLLAPWLDLAIRNPEVDVVERRDPWLTRPGLRACAEAWAGDLSMDDPRVSPLFGRLDDLPPIDLYVGTRDLGLPDARQLAGQAPSVTLHEEPGAVHVYPLLPLVPEGRRARAELLDGVSRALGSAGA